MAQREFAGFRIGQMELRPHSATQKPGMPRSRVKSTGRTGYLRGRLTCFVNQRDAAPRLPGLLYRHCGTCDTSSAQPRRWDPHPTSPLGAK
jgi:hypothetical protein